MNQQSNQSHSIHTPNRDESHRRVQVYPVERTSEVAPYNSSSRDNPPAPDGPQHQWYQARGEPAIQTLSHSDHRTPQHYVSVNSHSRAEAEAHLQRVPWQDGPSQTAEVLYSQDSRTTHFVSSPPTTVPSSRDRQRSVSDWELERRDSEPGYEHRDAYGFNSLGESHRRNAMLIGPGSAGSSMNLDHERQGPPMVPRHPSLQSFGPYTTTVLHPGRNPSTLPSAGDRSRSHSNSHVLHSGPQQFQTHQNPHNTEAPQYVVPSSRIPRTDLTARTSSPDYYNSAGVFHDPEETSETKPKRRRANVAQLKLLNDTYARTMFPTTEERADIARRINMTPRQVQIWFQNRRQASRQSQTLEPGTPSGSTFEGLYGDGHSDYLHEPEND